MSNNIKIILVSLSCCVFAYNNFDCEMKSVFVLLKQPAYKFSIKLLQKVAEDKDSHFVFSPVTTWMTLMALSQGASGETFEEIWRITKHQRSRCFQIKFYNLVSRILRALKYNSRRRNVITIEKLMAVKARFILDVQDVYGIEVLLLDFNKAEKAASYVNDLIEDGTEGFINHIVCDDDFISSVLLLSDANAFHGNWLTEFYYGYTKPKPFYSHTGTTMGKVSMMHQKGYFHTVELTEFGVNVLEMPLEISDISMFLFLPLGKVWIGDLFYTLEKMDLYEIVKVVEKEEQKLVNLALPKFSQLSEVENLPEILGGMGITRIFNSKLAELPGISKYNVHVSLMTQMSHIVVNETGVRFGVEFVAINETSVDFIANRPFAYIVLDKTSDFIIYAGVYSLPNKSGKENEF